MNALEVVQKFQESMGSGNDDWQNMFDEDIMFKGPVDTVKGIEANIELNKNFLPLMAGYEPLNMIEKDNYVVLEGKYLVNAPSGRTINLETSETYEVKNDKIRNIRIYYDAEEFRKEFGLTK